MTAEVLENLAAEIMTAGWVAPEQLDAAQKRAKADGKPLEETLLQMRLVVDSQLSTLKASRLGIPFCDLTGFIPNLQNAKLLPEEVARRHVMFPLFVLDGNVTLIMADPLDVAGIDQVRLRSRMEVEPCVGSPNDIMGLIERAYGAHRYLQRDAAAAAGIAATADGDLSQPVIKLVENLLREAVHQRASDIHIEPAEDRLRVRIRVDGVLREVAAPPLQLHRAIVSRLKVLSKTDISQARRPQDGSFHHSSDATEVVVRVSFLPTIHGEAVVLRLLRHGSETITLSELNIQDEVRQSLISMIERPHGIILVCGPTGSGKSTTLYAAMHHIASPQRNLIAIEDPVEYRTNVVRQVQVNTEAELTFAAGLRSILRQDPDVIMVGEIRDQETAQIAVQASLTGHLVLSTVHTNDAIGSVVRLREIGIPGYLLSASLVGVLAQRLCRRVCGGCAAPATVHEAQWRPLGLESAQVDFQPQRGRGCRKCMGSGYSGRLGVFELFAMNERYSEMIVRGEPAEAIRAAAKADGMRFLIDDGIDKIRKGLTTVEEVARVAAIA